MDGRAAEDRALQYLRAQGLELVARNWRCKAGELDLIMRDAGTLVIAEVRSRRRADYGEAAETVDWRKRARLVRATRVLLAARPQFADCPLRFDVVTLDGDGRVEWLREAFEAEE